MTPQQNLHYAIGQIAYSIALADGTLQREEAGKFMDIVTKELRDEDLDFDVSEIIFEILSRQKADSESIYNQAMKDIRLNSHYLSPALKNKFLSVMEKVATAFPPITEKESALMEKFKKEVALLNGDPVYYNQGVKI